MLIECTNEEWDQTWTIVPSRLGTESANGNENCQETGAAVIRLFPLLGLVHQHQAQARFGAPMAK